MTDVNNSSTPEGPSTVSRGPLSARTGILVTIGILLGLLMGALDQFVVLTALPTILHDFGSPNSGSFVVSAYVISSAASIPIFSKLSDLWSRRNVFLGGLAVFIGGSILSGLSQNLGTLVAFRAIQGFGTGGFLPVGISMVAMIFPPKTRARVTGFLSGVFAIAIVVGPVLGSTIIQYTTWRWVFYVNIPVGLLGFAILLATLGPLRPEIKRKFDTVGAALLLGWVASLMYPLYQIGEGSWSWTEMNSLGLFSLGIALLVGFVVWELRATHPLVPIRMFANRVIWAGGGSTFLRGAVFFPIITFVTLIVGIVLSPGATSSSPTVRDILYFVALPLVVGAALSGQLLTRLSYRTVAAVGQVIAIAGMVGLIGLSSTTPLWKFALGFIPVGGLILPLIPLGFGIGLTFPVFLLAAQQQVKPVDVGEATGLIAFLQQLGGSVGLSVLASYQATVLASLDPSPSPLCTSRSPPLPLCGSYLHSFATSFVSSYDQVFTAMVVILVVSLVFSLFVTGRLLKEKAHVEQRVQDSPATTSA